MNITAQIGSDDDGLEIKRYCLAGQVEGPVDLDANEIALIREAREKLHFWQAILGGSASAAEDLICRRAEEHNFARFSE